MNAYLNYVLEANIGLCLFLLFYRLLLGRETDFRFKRGWLLSGLVASLLFPLFHFGPSANTPILSEVIPVTWLPEFTITGDGQASVENPAAPVWTTINIIYLVGAGLFVLLFVWRMVNLMRVIRRAETYKYGKLKIIESSDIVSSFSFFGYIIIGQADKLLQEEKLQIIAHESEHARRYHSADVLLIQILRIIFWFNPLLKSYQKIFIQLHEFEADARAVRNRDTNDYCSLVARVALLSADIKLANHFSNSLTLKRIEMMRTIKTKIKLWKIAAVAGVLPLFFFIAACQDQVLTEVTEIAKASTMTMDYPPVIQEELARLKKENPAGNYIVVIPDETAADQAENLKKKLEAYDPAAVNSMYVKKDVADKDGVKRNYVILDYNAQAKQVAETAAGDDKIYMVVEEAAAYPGGLDAMRTFLATNLVYPQEARTRGIEGTVFVSFVVGLDGQLSDFNVVKGVGEWVDEAAVNVIKKMPPWTPGKQSGKVVKSRFVLPINFKLN